VKLHIEDDEEEPSTSPENQEQENAVMEKIVWTPNLYID